MLISVKKVSKSLVTYFLRIINLFSNHLLQTVYAIRLRLPGLQYRVTERPFFGGMLSYLLHIFLYFITFLYNQSFGRGCKFY